MAGPRTVIVVNPRSQGGALGDAWQDVSRVLRRELGSFEEARTGAPGDATRLCREALENGADRVVAVGGDGTINEVANGFFDGERAIAPSAALGIIPFGTGGDFRKTVHLATDVADAARVIATGNARPIDVGHLTYQSDDGTEAERIFLNIASFGISGVVDDLVNRSSKRFGGKVSFLVATARAGLTYQNQRVRLVFDGRETEPVDVTARVVAVANGRYFGGGMRIAPDADPDDGLFDVVCVGDMGLREMVLYGHRIYQGTHLNLEKVTSRRARHVRAESIDSGPVRLDVDGETPGRLPATFRLLPSALQLLAP